MLSLLNSYGGLSATELLTLFAANSSASSAGSTPAASKTQSALTGVSATGANDPANAIQAILVQAQIEKAVPFTQTEPQTAAAWGAGSMFGNAVEAAYAAVAIGGSGLRTTGEVANLWDAGVAGTNVLISENFTSASSASASVDTFQETLGIDETSVSFGFALEGLGQITPLPNEEGINVGQGDLADFFEMQLSAGQSGISDYFTVSGLTETQAKQLGAAFQVATADAGANQWGNFIAVEKIGFQYVPPAPADSS